MHPWMTARLLEQRRQSHQHRTTHPSRRRPTRRSGHRLTGRRSRWFDRVVPAAAAMPRRRSSRRP